jgi:hypothetical protein
MYAPRLDNRRKMPPGEPPPTPLERQGTIDVATTLAKLPEFASLSDETIACLGFAFVERRHEADSFVAGLQDVHGGLHILLEGQVEAELRAADGSVRRCSLSPGSIFGSLRTGCTAVGYRCLGPTQIASVAPRTLSFLMHAPSPATRAFRRAMASMPAREARAIGQCDGSTPNAGLEQHLPTARAA